MATAQRAVRATSRSRELEERVGHDDERPNSCLGDRGHSGIDVPRLADANLNVVVPVVQLFVKTPPLVQLVPTQQEAPFAVRQALVLFLLVWLEWAARRGFRNGSGPQLAAAAQHADR